MIIHEGGRAIYGVRDKNCHTIEIGKSGNMAFKIDVGSGWYISQIEYDDSVKDATELNELIIKLVKPRSNIFVSEGK